MPQRMMTGDSFTAPEPDFESLFQEQEKYSHHHQHQEQQQEPQFIHHDSSGGLGGSTEGDISHGREQSVDSARLFQAQTSDERQENKGSELEVDRSGNGMTKPADLGRHFGFGDDGKMEYGQQLPPGHGHGHGHGHGQGQSPGSQHHHSRENSTSSQPIQSFYMAGLNNGSGNLQQGGFIHDLQLDYSHMNNGTNGTNGTSQPNQLPRQHQHHRVQSIQDLSQLPPVTPPSFTDSSPSFPTSYLPDYTTPPSVPRPPPQQQQQSNSNSNSIITYDPYSSLQQAQALDPMMYRSPIRQGQSPHDGWSPQPSPCSTPFIPTHSNRPSFTGMETLSSSPHNGTNTGMNQNTFLTNPNLQRRLSVMSHLSYQGSIHSLSIQSHSGSGLGGLEDEFANTGWGEGPEGDGGGAGTGGGISEGYSGDGVVSYEVAVRNGFDGNGTGNGNGVNDQNHSQLPTSSGIMNGTLDFSHFSQTDENNQRQSTEMIDERVARYLAETMVVGVGNPGINSLSSSSASASASASAGDAMQLAMDSEGYMGQWQAQGGYEDLAMLTGNETMQEYMPMGNQQQQHMQAQVQQEQQQQQQPSIPSLQSYHFQYPLTNPTHHPSSHNRLPSDPNAVTSVAPQGRNEMPEHLRANLQQLYDSYGPSEFARRMNSMASDFSKTSTSGETSPNQPVFFDGAISEAPMEGIAMPPIPSMEMTSVAGNSRKSGSKSPLSNRNRKSGTQAKPPTPIRKTSGFIRPSPPPGTLPHKQPHLQSPFAIKPQSPPQLVIPDTSSTPPQNSHPPSSFQNQSQGPSTGTTGSGSTLLPPANPLLGIPSGGNGFGGPYMSPIGPTGPSINIVPSTPISALRAGQHNQGIWENLAQQARQAQAAQGGAGQASVSTNTGWVDSSQRRNSHAGTYTTHAPTSLPLGNADMSNNGQGYVPPSAPADMRQRSIVPQRQRSRSEAAIKTAPSMFDYQISQLLQDAQTDLISSQMSAQMTTNGIPSGYPLGSNNSQIIPGPEAYGANYIMANDGSRIGFQMPWGGSFPGSGVDQYPPPSMDYNGATPNGCAPLPGAILQGEAGARMGRPLHRSGARSEDLHHSPKLSLNTTNLVSNSMVNPVDGSLLPPHPVTGPTRNMGLARSNSVTSSGGRDSSPYARPQDRRGSNASSIASSAMSRRGSHGASVDGSSDGLILPPGVPPPGKSKKPARQRVTTEATEAASKGRRTSDGQYICPVPGCGSTFTRQFNLKGHIRSHNEERPYICTHLGCDKGFARRHDCKRHMQLHVGVKPFQCEGCQKQFARLDALSRHHKTDSGVECARIHPLPLNSDGTLLTEGTFKKEMAKRRSTSRESDRRVKEGTPDGLMVMNPQSDDEDDEGEMDMELGIQQQEDVKPVLMDQTVLDGIEVGVGGGGRKLRGKLKEK